MSKTLEQEAADYLLSPKYRRLLYRAIISRFGTSSAHKQEHAEALRLLKAAFPNEELICGV